MKQNNTIKYFGNGFEIPKIEEESHIPIGSKICSNELCSFIHVDNNNLTNLLDEMNEREEGLNRDALRNNLKNSNATDVDENLFAALYAFTDIYNKKIGFNPNETERREAYHKGIPHLSQIIGNNLGMCSELSILAQLYLQEKGINSSYFNGEVVWSKDNEFPESHSFIHLKNGKEYIFDPMATPKLGNGLVIPALKRVKDFKGKLSKDKKSYIETKDIISKKSTYYGVGNHTNFNEKFIVN